MIIAIWSEGLATGNEMVDSQHKRLFEMINQMYESLGRGDDRQLVTDILDELAAYTLYHFAEEEAFMERMGYPDLPSHREMHAEMRGRVRHLQEDHHYGAEVLSQEFALFLAAWLNEHIKQVDQKMVTWVNAHHDRES